MQRAIFMCAIVSLGLVLSGCVSAEESSLSPGSSAKVAPVATRGVVSAVVVAKGPAIDGTLSSPVWQKAPVLGLGKLESAELGGLKTNARVLMDDKNLYVAWECVEPATSELAATVKTRDGVIWEDDCVELFVSADNKTYYHFIANSAGALYDSKGDMADASAEDKEWNSAAVVKVSIDKNKCYVVTMSVPLKDLGAKSGKDQAWALNLNRTKPGSGDVRYIESTWSAKGKSKYADSSGWGKLTGVKVP